MHSQPNARDSSEPVFLACQLCGHLTDNHKIIRGAVGDPDLVQCSQCSCIQTRRMDDGLWILEPLHDPVSHPKHYTEHPGGIECIQVTEHMNFCLGNAVKYIWRAGLKSDDPIQDLEKSVWYVQREIQRLKDASTS